MSMTVQPTPAMPRWKTIRDELHRLLPQYEYGDRFFSIAEICDKYGVSTITARRVLSELQSQGLVEKIRSRGTIVRRLAKTTRVRLVMPAGVRPDYEIFSATVRRLIAGITENAAEQRIDFDTVSEAHLKTLFARRDDEFGFLVLSGVSPHSIRWLARQGWPYVLTNPLRYWKRQPQARTDRRQAGYLAAQHLIGRGHRRIAYVLGAISRAHFRDRLKGYRDALHDAGLTFRWSMVRETDGEQPELDHRAVEELLALPSPPTAIICCDDHRAIRILEALRRHGLKVPDDISVLGYPNHPESKLTQPALSVVNACYEKVGAAAVRLLLKRMYEGIDPCRQISVIQPQLIERGTTAAPPQPRRRRTSSTDRPDSSAP